MSDCPSGLTFGECDYSQLGLNSCDGCKEKADAELSALRARVAELEADLTAERERHRVTGESLTMARLDGDAAADALEKRVAELEVALDEERKQAAFYGLQAQRIMTQRDAEKSRASAAEQRVKRLEGALRTVHPERVAPERGVDPPVCLECGDEYLLDDGCDPSAECDSCAQAMLSEVRKAACAVLAASDSEVSHG